MEMYFLCAGLVLILAVICFVIWFIFHDDPDELNEEKPNEHSHNEINELFSEHIKKQGKSIIFNNPSNGFLNGCAPECQNYNIRMNQNYGKSTTNLASSCSKYHSNSY